MSAGATGELAAAEAIDKLLGGPATVLVGVHQGVDQVRQLGVAAGVLTVEAAQLGVQGSLVDVAVGLIDVLDPLKVTGVEQAQAQAIQVVLVGVVLQGLVLALELLVHLGGHVQVLLVDDVVALELFERGGVGQPVQNLDVLAVLVVPDVQGPDVAVGDVQLVEMVQTVDGLVGDVHQFVAGELAAGVPTVVDLLLEVRLGELVVRLGQVVRRAEFLLDGGGVAGQLVQVVVVQRDPGLQVADVVGRLLLGGHHLFFGENQVVGRLVLVQANLAETGVVRLAEELVLGLVLPLLVELSVAEDFSLLRGCVLARHRFIIPGISKPL